jgi:uncharacterized MnhB-related membrane protein
MSQVFDIVLILLLIAAAVSVVRLKDLLAAAIVFSSYSLLLWLHRGAPDVAMTEAAVGAGVTTVLFLVAISRTTRKER